ncbi:MAG: hypothetical protein HQK51_21895, partial [Oligoflexia bacterium]|nr:hypothetical protein [Oligoflexia bacterium]
QKNNGMVAIVVENEPENINAMIREFPHAEGFFVNGAYLKQEVINSKVVKINDFYSTSDLP